MRWHGFKIAFKIAYYMYAQIKCYFKIKCFCVSKTFMNWYDVGAMYTWENSSSWVCKYLKLILEFPGGLVGWGPGVVSCCGWVWSLAQEHPGAVDRAK